MTNTKKLSPSDIANLNQLDQDRVGLYTNSKHLVQKRVVGCAITLAVGIIGHAMAYRWWSLGAAQGIAVIAGIGVGWVATMAWENYQSMKSAQQELLMRGLDPSSLEFHHYINDYLAPKLSKAMEDMGMAHNVVDADGNVVKSVSGKNWSEIDPK